MARNRPHVGFEGGCSVGVEHVEPQPWPSITAVIGYSVVDLAIPVLLLVSVTCPLAGPRDYMYIDLFRNATSLLSSSALDSRI